MKRSTHGILTTHNGSLPRLPELLPQLLAKDQGKPYDHETFETTVRKAVADVVKRQVDAGITVLNDGEQSKLSYLFYIKDRLTGLGVEEDRARQERAGEDQEFPEYFARSGSRATRRPVCTGPIDWKDFGAVQKDIDNLKAAVKGVQAQDVFMSSNSPGNSVRTIHNRYYRTGDEYLQAVADALKREYKAIVDAGFLLQIDCPDLASAGSREADLYNSQAKLRAMIAHNVEVLNGVTKQLPPEQMRIHVCWGAGEGPHNRDVELKVIVDLLLKTIAAGVTIVGANGRHEHEWKVWKDVKVPDGKAIVPGVIDSTCNFIEHPEAVAERIVRYAGVLGKENVIAGVDCGFATSVGNAAPQVDPKISWAKLKSLSDGAALATKELWRK